ncbi:hypothetical protein [Streptomyces sp. NPDC060243]|uniref:hypothetical protein n=1 Tax=Streptomyces sp. NPDC060243 TaxID=3347081 RepID=UPI0036574C93
MSTERSGSESYRSALETYQGISSIDDVLRLAPPGQFESGEFSGSQCAALVEAIKDAWIPILERRSIWDDGAASRELGAREAWTAASLSLACHFSFFLQKSEAHFLYGGEPGWSPFTVSFQDDILSADFGFDAAVERKLLSEFCKGWWSSFFMEIVGSAAMGRTPVGYDLFVFWSLEHMSSVALASARHDHMAMAHFFSRELTKRSREGVDRRDKADIDFRDKVWRDAVGVRELTSLASRSKWIVEKYGEKNVEAKFEEVLSLIFQRLGFMVMPTQQGQRRVDLICISPGSGSDSYTVLVEAKSSSHGYALPTKDARAITEYIDSVRDRLRTLPPLRLVLIVGPVEAKTLRAKVEALSHDSPVPVRYVPARTLAYLRENLRGVVPAQPFLRAMTSSGFIVDVEAVKPVVDSFNGTRSAHADFISKLLE